MKNSRERLDSVTSILILDDEDMIRKSLEITCKKITSQGELKIILCESLEECQNTLKTQLVHVLLLDRKLKNPKTGVVTDSLPYLASLLNQQPFLQILMVTGSTATQDVVTAIKSGAFGYLSKSNPQDLLICQIEKACQMAQLTLAKSHFSATTESKQTSMGGHSNKIKKVLSDAKSFAATIHPILILGETGTGKTVLARQIHQWYQEHKQDLNRPFVSLNLSAIPQNLLERELFGNEKGAFTDAKDRKIGFFELANSGTLFLDEIGDINSELQVKLLKVIEEKRFYRLGGDKEVFSNFRVICATHRNLENLVGEGSFREDLFMRISTLQLMLPALADRKEDIPDIVRAVLPKLCRQNELSIEFDDLPPEFLAYISSNSTRGNIRGIEQQISRLMILSPRDRSDRPDFQNWKEVLQIPDNNRTSNSRKTPLTLEEFMALPLNIVNDNFPGIGAILESVEERIYMDADKKYKANNLVAEVLKVSNATVSIKLKRIKDKALS